MSRKKTATTDESGAPKGMSLEMALQHLVEIARLKGEGTLHQRVPGAVEIMNNQDAFEVAIKLLPILKKDYENEVVPQIEWYRTQVDLWDAHHEEP